MNRRMRVWALLSAASCSFACGTEAPLGGASAGSSGTGTAGASAGMAGAGVATAGGGATSTAGSGGQPLGGGGSASGGTSAGAGGSAGGSSGGTLGSGGTAGAGGSAGSGGSGGADNSTLPKRVLLYHFSTYAIDSVPAQLTLLKTQLMTWGFEVEDSVKPDDISTTNLARFGGVAMINTCFEPFGTGKTGETQTAAL